MADEEKAVFVGLKNDAEESLPKAASHFGEFHEGTASELSGQIEKHATDDLNLKSEIDGIDQTPVQTGASNIVTRTTSTGATRDVQYYSFSDEELEAAGITSKGADDVETGGTDPVDLVSGQLIASATDLVRLGVLPLVVRRAYTSGYAHGGVFGPGWASTFDIRLLVDEDGVRFLGESAQVLDYGVPAGLNLGLPAAPIHGARWPLSRERDCYRVDDPETGTSWLFPQDGDGEVRALREIRDRNGNQIILERAGSGAAMELAHSGGYRVQAELLETPAGPRVAALTLLPADGAGISVLSYGYDEAGRLATITDSTGVAYLYEWDEHDRICGWVDRNGHDYRYAYDEDGRVIAAWGAGGFLTSQISYDRVNRVTRVTDGSGAAAAYHYNRYQQVVKIVDPIGGVELIERDRYGRVLASTDPLGSTARTERDGSGLPLRFTAPDGAETQLAYNGSGQPVRVIEPNGAAWRLEYDAHGNLVHRTDPLGGQVSYTYDARGGITAVTDPLGAVARFELDDAGLQIGVTDPLGGRWRIRRDEFGRVTALTDPAGSERRSYYSVEGQLLRSEDDLGGSVRYAYDPVGNLIERVDAAGAVTRFEYGPMGLRTASIDAVGNRHIFTYDSELRLASVTGPTGLEWTYTYDAAGRLVGERDFDGRELTYRLDAAGRRVEQVSGSGEHTRFEYDMAGRLTGRVAAGVEHRFAYDVTGHMVRAEGSGTLLEITRDLLSRPVAESVNGGVLTRDYDAAGNLVRRVTPSGAVTDWGFDAAGNPLRLATASAEITFGYDYAGREIVRRFGPEVELRRGYDAAGRMTGTRLSSTGGRLPQERTYAYRADGAVERISDHLRGARHYALDPLGRPTSVHAERFVEAYTYDPLGTVQAANEAQSLVTAGTQVLQDARFSYSYDADGRLVSKQQHTGDNHDLAWTYTWDALGHLTAASTPDRGIWRYTYDPLGRRNAKMRVSADGSVLEHTEFTYDGPRLVEERHIDTSGVVRTTTWDYEPDSFLPAAQTRRRVPGDLSQPDVDEQFHAIVADLVGTPLELVTADGTITALKSRPLWGDIHPPGPDTHDVDPCPLRFPGQYYDAETGLHYNLHRYYDPATASYLSPDPLGLLPAPNPRTYIGNPLTESDPLGLNGEGVDKPVPGLNLSGAKRVPYGEDPMSKLAITARRSFKNGLTSGKNVAVYLYRDGENNVRALAIHSDLVHSERLGWSTLSDKLGIGKDQIDSIYTELQPCGPIYHDCDQWLSKNMDGVPVSYSFDYGPTKAGQTAGMNSLRRALTQVRQGNLPK